MSKKVLIAGGGGFIGSHLVDFLLSKDYEVDVLDSFITGRKVNLNHIQSKKLRVIEHDINTPYQADCTYTEIYNLASPASPLDFNKIPVFILRTAAEGHKNLLDMAMKMKARILYASTSEVYGDPLEHPQNEAYWGNVNPIGHRGCYDEAKRYGEALTMAYHRHHHVNTCIVRIFNTYGPRMRPEDGRIIPNFFMQALKKERLTIHGDGSQTRSFCYVSDMVEGIYAIMKSKEHEPINIGNPDERTVSDMADVINRLVGNSEPHRFLPLPPDDPRRRWPDVTKAKEKLKWAPKVNLEAGLEKSLTYFSSFVQ